VACVLAITLVALLLRPLPPEPVTVKFLCSRNDNGKKVLVFIGTNGLPTPITFYSHLRIPTRDELLLPIPISRGSYAASADIGAGAIFTFSLAMPRTSTNSVVDWYFLDPAHVPTRWEKLRLRCCIFLALHHLRPVARLLIDRRGYHTILPSELKE